jgi:hypothetical protein
MPILRPLGDERRAKTKSQYFSERIPVGFSQDFVGCFISVPARTHGCNYFVHFGGLTVKSLEVGMPFI